MQFRAMQEADAKKVLAIETSATAYPWSLSQFVDSATSIDDVTVLEADNNLVGFIVFKRVLDEATLLNIAIDPSYQGRGLGRRLLEFGLAQQYLLGARHCFLEVRLSNQKAQQLYQSLDFTVVGERKNYYPLAQGREDALVMRTEIPSRLLETKYSGVIDESC
jgi:ribosomal-protein-alanine N-acetyltransferase